MSRPDVQLRLFLMLVMVACGAACALGYEVLMCVRGICRGKVIPQLLDVLWAVLSALLIVTLWYRIDGVKVHYTVPMSLFFGFLIGRLGVGFYVRLCLEKWINTICCRGRKNVKKS